MRQLIFEFLRYAVVGGVAFLSDFGTLVGVNELLLGSGARSSSFGKECGV